MRYRTMFLAIGLLACSLTSLYAQTSGEEVRRAAHLMLDEAAQRQGSSPTLAAKRFSFNQCCTPAPQDMSAWWPFDESQGQVAFDIAGAIEDNGLHHGPVTMMTLGQVQGAICYDGASAYTEVANSPEVDFGNHCEVDAGNSFTIDFWILADASMANGVYTILDKRDVTNSGNTLTGYSVYLFNGRIGFQIASGNGPFICDAIGTVCQNTTSPFSVVDGSWHFVAITVYQGCRFNSALFYDNGQVSTFTPKGSSMANNANLQIARRSPALQSPNFFSGCLDELEFISPGLLISDLDDIHNAGSIGKCKPKPRSY